MVGDFRYKNFNKGGVIYLQLCSEFFLLRVSPAWSRRPRPILKKSPARLSDMSIIDLRRYQVYEKENTKT